MKELSLNGTWELRDESLSKNSSESVKGFTEIDRDWIACPVPGDIHQGLMAAGRITDPLLGLNSFDCRWTEDRAWWFRKKFPTRDEWIDVDAVELELAGLDANASVYLNGRHLGDHRNTFYPFIKNISDCLNKGGENILLVRLTAGIENVAPEDQEKLGVPVPTEAVNGRPERIDPKRVFVRKPQFSFGWDWSPRLATTGITDNVKIRWSNNACIRDVRVKPVRLNDRVILSVTATVDSIHDHITCRGQIDLAIAFEGQPIASASKNVLLKSGLNYISFDVVIENPKLWWPNGMGPQHLYIIDTRLTVENEPSSYPAFQYGIRFVELDTQDKFALIVNGKKIFCKGANWVPADAIYARVTDEKCEALVRQARDANCNMLRVWGGGLYERDAFYKACDRYGIMIWQDFMFACAPYPDHLDWFRHQVAKEADYQTKRLRNHPSVVLWCGNNECIQGMVEWWQNKSRSGYRLYNYILPEAVQKNCPEIPYWNGSPYGGSTPNASDVGDRHHWPECSMSQYMHLRITPEEYDKCTSLFVSEYGYFGAPSKKTVLAYLDGAKPDRQSPVWQHHNNTFEKGTVEAGIAKHYADTEKLSFDDYLLYSGLTQGLMYYYSLESFRARSECHGGLIWMLEDCWGEVGWSIIDYYLRRKIAWYYVKRALSPVLLALRSTDDKITVTIANDTPQQIAGVLEYGHIALDGSSYQMRQLSFTAPPLERKQLVTFDKDDADPHKNLWFAAVQHNDNILPAILRTGEFRHLQMPQPHLSYHLTELSDHRWLIKVKSDVYAHAVHLHLPASAVPSDDYFDLLPSRERNIVIHSKLPFNAKTITLTSFT